MANPTILVPLVMTDDLAATRAFYVERLGMPAAFDMTDYLQVRFGDAQLAFMNTGSPANMHAAEPFDGRGLLVSIPVEDADAWAAELDSRGVDRATEASDKPWGWRSFHVVDPNGVVLDFFHALETPEA